MQYLIYAADFRKVSKNSNDPNESAYPFYLQSLSFIFKHQQANFPKLYDNLYYIKKIRK